MLSGNVGVTQEGSWMHGGPARAECSMGLIQSPPMTGSWWEGIYFSVQADVCSVGACSAGGIPSACVQVHPFRC